MIRFLKRCAVGLSQPLKKKRKIHSQEENERKIEKRKVRREEKKSLYRDFSSLDSRPVRP